MQRKKRADDISDGKRFREILSILARHRLARGLTPEKLRHILEDLGPTYVKMGQILSMRSDILPESYCRQLMTLRSQVAPMDIGTVRSVIADAYGKPSEEVFASIDPTPLGAASIAQAHLAALPDGRQAVVKVQRPHIRETMTQDISLLKRAGKFMKLTPVGSALDLNMVLDEMWAVAQQEMDFTSEARNIEEFSENNAEIAYVVCPSVYKELTTPHILTMEYIEGIQIDDLDSLVSNGYDPVEIAEKLAENYVKQVVDDRFFHADPHPGNLRVRDGKIVYLDLGMMGRLSKRDALLFRRALRAVTDHDTEALKDIVLSMGVYTAQIDQIKLMTDIDGMLCKYKQLPLSEMNLSSMVDEFLALANSHGISMPRGMTLFARSLLIIEGVLSTLSPDINILEIMSAHLSGQLFRDIDWNAEILSFLQSSGSSCKKVTALPGQISDLLRKTSKGQTKLNIEWTGSDRTAAAAERLVNRMVRGMASAAMILGACLLCLSGDSPVFPWLPVSLFAAACVLMIPSFRKKRK